MTYATVSSQRTTAEINVTPLVDVMLVLLVIFMIAMPIWSQPIQVSLQRGDATPDRTPPPPIKLRIEVDNQIYWNDSPTPLSALQNMMQAEVDRDPRHSPTLEIETNDDAEYQVLAKVLAAAKNAEMLRIGFVQDQ